MDDLLRTGDFEALAYFCEQEELKVSNILQAWVVHVLLELTRCSVTGCLCA